MTLPGTLSRRSLLTGSVCGAAALVLGFKMTKVSAGTARHAAGTATFSPHAFLRISADGRITTIIGPAEMGQGVFTALAMIVADELGARWSDMAAEASPADPAYGNPLFGGLQATNASTSIPVFYESMRHAAAAARMMLISTAAERWGVLENLCSTAESAVVGPGGRRSAFSDLVIDAAGRAPPSVERLTLKDPSEFRIIGKSMPRLEGRQKVTGQPIFGLDVDLPGMLTASVARKPLPHAQIKSFDRSAALAVRDVVAVVEIPTGVAVLGRHYWAARSGRDKLAIEWDLGNSAELLSSQEIEAKYRELTKIPGSVSTMRGDPTHELAHSMRVIEREYVLPYVAHAPMEPLNCTIAVNDGRCDVWLGTQYQSLDKKVAAQVLGLPVEKVHIHTLYLGGSFGRRGSPDGDVVKETAEIVAAVRDFKVPIRNVWAREDDIRGGLYRPMALNRLKVALGDDGYPRAWAHTIVARSPCIHSEFSFLVANGVDETNVAGAKDLPYHVPHFILDVHAPEYGASVQWLRAVGNSNTCFAIESLIDELAHLAGCDPVEYRRHLLGNDPKNARLRNVLDLAVSKAGWGSGMSKGRGIGVALQDYWGTKAAQVAEVEVVADRVVVRRITCAIDCGRVINPDGVKAQVESAVVFALSAALYGEIELERGLPKQSNFDDYPLLRMAETPAIDVVMVASTEPPSGIGEAAVPHVAPAVFNAIFAATGRRIRRLPLVRSGLRS